jgi:hypothetical protein
MRRSLLSIVALVTVSTGIVLAQTVPTPGFSGRWSLALQTKPSESVEFVVAGSANAITGTFDRRPFSGAVADGVLSVTLAHAADASAYTTITATRLPNGNLTGTMVYNFEYAPGQWMGKSSHFVAAPMPVR